MKIPAAWPDLQLINDLAQAGIISISVLPYKTPQARSLIWVCRGTHALSLLSAFHCLP